ncbi:MAG: hypothetical protein QF561_04725 [Phycisphaerales bacterium]|nr:hypothetical protein [Phycisphaerales bacterium]
MDERLYVILMERFHLAGDGEAHVLTMKHGGQTNRALRRIVERAGVEPWRCAFQTLRSSREQIWCDEFPQSVVSAWIGHSITVSGKHYANRALDHHFEAAAAPRAGVAQNAAQHVPESRRTVLHRENDPELRIVGSVDGANTCDEVRVGASAPKSGAGGIRTLRSNDRRRSGSGAVLQCFWPLTL